MLRAMRGLVAVREPGLLFLYYPTPSSSFHPVGWKSPFVDLRLVRAKKSSPFQPSFLLLHSYLGIGQGKKGKRWITTVWSFVRHRSDTHC